MFETIAVILLLLWIVGGFALHIAGGLIHILLLLAIVVFAMRFFKRKVY